MEDHLINDLILMAVATILGAIAWFLRGIHSDVKKLSLAGEHAVTHEVLRPITKELHDRITSLSVQVGILMAQK